MKHARGIALFSEVEYRQTSRETFALRDLQGWYALHGKCTSCGHIRSLDRWELERRFGRGTPVIALMPHLRCTKCGNRANNVFCVSKMQR